MDNQNFQREVMRAIGNLEGKVTEGFKSMDGQFANMTTRLNNHSGKINELEKISDNWAGRMSVISVIFGLIGSLVFAFIKKLLNI